MTFMFTEEQLEIQASAKKFSRKILAATAMERDRTGEFPAENLKKMGALGYLGMMIPPEYNGVGADTVSYTLALAEIAYSCASTAVVMAVHNCPVCESICRFGTEEQKEKYLTPLAAGKYIGAFAMTEPHAGSDPARMLTTAVRDGDYYILNGNKRFITTGKNSGLVIVMAKTDATKHHKGISAFIVEKETPGLIVGKVEDKMGLRASDTTDLVFEDCRIPSENLLGTEGDGFKLAMVILDAGRIGIAAQAIGIAQAALDAAVQYAQQREQFGQPISKFQGLRWMIADMATEMEAARQLTLFAAALKDGDATYTAQASMAKLYASETANRITGTALQIHGGYGFMKDYEVERFYRDARVLTIYEGTSEIQRVVISNQLFGQV